MNQDPNTPQNPENKQPEVPSLEDMQNAIFHNRPYPFKVSLFGKEYTLRAYWKNVIAEQEIAQRTSFYLGYNDPKTMIASDVSLARSRAIVEVLLTGPYGDAPFLMNCLGNEYQTNIFTNERELALITSRLPSGLIVKAIANAINEVENRFQKMVLG